MVVQQVNKRICQGMLKGTLRILVLSTHLKNSRKHFKMYQYGLDYLFNEHNKEDNTSNNAFNEVRKLFNEHQVIFNLKKQRELEKNSIKKRLSITF